MPVTDPTLRSDKQDWQTPPDFFAVLHRHWKFDTDVAAHADNALLPHYFTDCEPGRDALTNSWAGLRCYGNPPYGKMAGVFVTKAAQERHRANVIVMLVAARVDTDWWWNWAMRANEIRFLKNRVTFVGAPNSATFPNALLVFHPFEQDYPMLTWWKWRTRDGVLSHWDAGLHQGIRTLGVLHGSNIGSSSNGIGSFLGLAVD